MKHDVPDQSQGAKVQGQIQKKLPFSALALAVPIGLSSHLVGIFVGFEGGFSLMHDVPHQGQGVKGQGQMLKK